MVDLQNFLAIKVWHDLQWLSQFSGVPSQCTSVWFQQSCVAVTFAPGQCHTHWLCRFLLHTTS